MNVGGVGLKFLPCYIKLNLYCQEAIEKHWLKQKRTWVREDKPWGDTANRSFVSFFRVLCDLGMGVSSPWHQVWRLTQETSPNVLDPRCSFNSETQTPGEAKPTSLPLRWSDFYFWLMLGSQSTCPQRSLWDWDHTLQNVCHQGQRSSSQWHRRGGCADVPQWTRHLTGRFHLDTPHSGVRLDAELVVQSLSRVQLFVIPWTAAHQASLSFAISQSLLKLMSIKLVMPSNHLTLCCSHLPSPPAFNLSQHQGIFQWVSYLHQVTKVLELQLQHQSFQWIFRTDFL